MKLSVPIFCLVLTATAFGQTTPDAKYTSAQLEAIQKENLNCLKKAADTQYDTELLLQYQKAIIEEEKTSNFPVNTAIRPFPKIESDHYDWYERHKEKVAAIGKKQYDLIFIGDSITHFWEGRGRNNWKQYYGERNVINIGFGWDRTQNVLWRLNNGEFKNQHPKVVVLNIGTNNLTGNRVRTNTPEEIIEGIEAICAFIHKQSPETKILIMDIFPRGKKAWPLFKQVMDTNGILDARMKDKPNITVMNVGDKFLDANGDPSNELMPDGVHPNEKGYTIWAEAIEPFLKEALK